MTEALWVSANFRWQVQNTSHRSDHKCRLEYKSSCNTLWCCKGAAVWMKGNKPICKKKNVVKKKRGKGKKYLGQQSNIQIQFSFMEWGNFVTEKKWRNSVFRGNWSGWFLHRPPLNILNIFSQRKWTYQPFIAPVDNINITSPRGIKNWNRVLAYFSYLSTKQWPALVTCDLWHVFCTCQISCFTLICLICTRSPRFTWWFKT